VSKPKPFFYGSNRAKKIAKSQDERDRRMILKKFHGEIRPHAEHHTALVRARHAAIRAAVLNLSTTES
jgi:hypothetical protein